MLEQTTFFQDMLKNFSRSGVNDMEDVEDEEDDDLENLCPKYLIFSTGSKTYTPHQVGFKRVRNVNFPKKLDPGPSLKERIAAKERERVLQVNSIVTNSISTHRIT